MNMYTNPGWFSLLFWVIFFIIILLRFSEYAYKTKPIIPSEESNILEKIDDNFYQPPHILKENEAPKEKINVEGKIESSDGGDTASVIVVQREIQEMLHEEEKAFSYMGTAFIILVSVLLVIRVFTYFKIR